MAGNTLLPLKPIEEAADSHEAVGIWWAGAVLAAHFDSGPTRGGWIRDEEDAELATRMIKAEAKLSQQAAARRPVIQEYMGKFASALAELSRESEARADGSRVIHNDYDAEPILVAAAETAGIPTPRRLGASGGYPTFPYKSMTQIEGDGTVIARLGATNQAVQVWPPTS
jgi:hypothetical protein